MSDKPVITVGTAGLAPRDRRLIEIVFDHGKSNRYRFRLAGEDPAEPVDLLIADATDPRGVRAIANARAAPARLPVIAVAPGEAVPAGVQAMPIGRLTARLLPILNRAIELDQQARALRSAPDELPAQPVARVLLVDDSAAVLEQLRMACERMGLACEAASSGAQALALLSQRRFDLALVDVVMPDMDGYQLTRQIRGGPASGRIPVIVLTSRSSPIDLARAALAGCATYLTKPVKFAALEIAVREQLARAEPAVPQR